MNCITVCSVVSCLLVGGCSSAAKNWDSVLEELVSGYPESMDIMTPVMRNAPTDCRAMNSGPRMSQSKSGSAHAQKRYHLFASDGEAYTKASTGEIPNPIGLMLVKETHATDPLDNDKRFVLMDNELDWSLPNRVHGEVADLFLMFKVGDELMPGTDRGWIYGGATPGGEVYASGLIESCMNCHQSAPYDRLFGLAPADTIYFQPMPATRIK